jgi:DNA polymerase-3 subunit delta'
VTPSAGAALDLDLGDGAGTVWADVVGQEAAVEHLRRSAGDPVHAYLFVGPPGCTKDEAARAFAALVLTGGVDDAHRRDARLALAGEHPDVREIERVGAAISADQAREIVRVAALAPAEGPRKVMILSEFHLLRAEGAALLLKTIEEPPPSTMFVVVADHVPPDLVTIASRCVRVEFRSIPDDIVEARLVAEGVPAARAADAARSAAGDLGRARVLASDDSLVARRAAFAGVPRRLDGTGATVIRLVNELQSLIEQAAAPLAERQEAEVAALDARAAQFGERGSGRKALEDRHRRELRRHRTDELRSGLAVLAGVYRDALVAGGRHRPDALSDAVHRIHRSLEALERNPNEALLLQALLFDLPSI